jgi:phosphatidylinositol 4-phosphatase
MWTNSVNYATHFAFNHELLKDHFSKEVFMPYRTPCIYGLFKSTDLIDGDVKTKFFLISRKDCRRPGRRFMVRGLDSEGNAANFCETEHIFT